MEWNVGMVAIIADMILQRGRKRGKGGGGMRVLPQWSI